MARPKSEDKRNAILQAATAVFAERGVWSTPTVAVSKAAGVAEGSLFTYFATKDVLANELYRALKLELADVLLAALPRGDGIETRFRHLWNQYVDWGLANPEKLKVLAQLQLSDQITAESQAIGQAPFAEIERMGVEIAASPQIRSCPVAFIGALFIGMAETTMRIIEQNKGDGFDYRTAGFDIFWQGISAH